MLKMKNKAQGRGFIIVLLVIIAVALIVIAYTLLVKPSMTGNVVKETQQTTTQAQPTQPQSYCGDGICNNGEGCSSCSADCGVCKPKDEYRIQISAVGCMGQMYVGPVRAIQLVVYKNNQAIYNFSNLKFEVYMDGELVSSGQPYRDRYYATNEGVTLFKIFDVSCAQPDISTVKIVLKDMVGNELDSVFGKYTFDGDVDKYLPSDTVCQGGWCSGSQ